MEIAIFTFNPFAENTYVLYDESQDCIIIDPGCNNVDEKKQLTSFIQDKNLKPVRLINTHCHIDHVLGNRFVADKYGLGLEAHSGEKTVLDSCVMVANMYQIPYDPSPEMELFLNEGDEIQFGNTTLNILFTPGHSPASISLYDAKGKILIAGDVIFRESIGRTDLPGGDFDRLVQSIKTKLYTLPDDTKVFPGHGPATSIGHEKQNNPFVKA